MATDQRDAFVEKKIEALKMLVKIWNIKVFGLIEEKSQVFPRRNGQARF